MIIKTRNIEEAINALQAGTCTHFDGSNAGWGDNELFRIILCLNEGKGVNLVELLLNGNNFSTSAVEVLCKVIGPTAYPAIAAAAADRERLNQRKNPQF